VASRRPAPADFPRDPAGRLVGAAARVKSLPLVARDTALRAGSLLKSVRRWRRASVRPPFDPLQHLAGGRRALALSCSPSRPRGAAPDTLVEDGLKKDPTPGDRAAGLARW
jgi:hypothetical protein